MPGAHLRRAAQLLFEREGFAGNIDHYDDPENSFLDAVIERRLGIPITLSVLMMAVGRRLGVDVQGVGMPGHFLVLDARAATCGAIPSTAARCSTRPVPAAGSISSTAARLAFQAGFLAPTSPHAILARMLANLERSRLAADPVQRAWMCALHLEIPGVPFDERVQLADQLATTGDAMRAASVFEQLAARGDGVTRRHVSRRAPRGRAVNWPDELSR